MLQVMGIFEEFLRVKIITFSKTELFSPETNAFTRFVSYETATTKFSVDLATKNLDLELMGLISNIWKP